MAVQRDPEVAWLHDVHEIRSLPQRYARAVDARDVDEIAELFHPGGRVEGAAGTMMVPEYLDSLRDRESPFGISQHLMTDPIIDLDVGADTGRSDTYAVVHQLRDEGDAAGDFVLGMRYLDEVVRHEGRWVIGYRRATMLWTRGKRP